MGMSDLYGPADEAESIATIHAALDAGVTLLDTGDFYGMGHNELLLREALRGRNRDEAVDQRQVRRAARTRRQLDRLRHPPGRDQELPRLHACAASAPTTSTSTGRPGSTRASRSRRPSARSPSWCRRATSATSASPRSAPTPCAGPTPCTPITDLQIEYSLLSRGIEDEILPTARELGIGITAYGVLSRGLLSGHWSADRDRPGDFRGHLPRFSGENLERNLALVEALRAVARGAGATVAQVAIAWVLSRGEDIVPLVGARRRDRLTESLGALGPAAQPE